jgi:hypothetical protein
MEALPFRRFRRKDPPPKHASDLSDATGKYRKVCFVYHRQFFFTITEQRFCSSVWWARSLSALL